MNKSWNHVHGKQHLEICTALFNQANKNNSLYGLLTSQANINNTSLFELQLMFSHPEMNTSHVI